MRQQQEIVILVTEIKKYSNASNISNAKQDPEPSSVVGSEITEEQRLYKNTKLE